MTKYFLSVLLLFATSALATITQVQSNATWGTSGTSCTVALTNTSNSNLLVVWATWVPSTVTVSKVADVNNTNPFPVAVGPTVQSVSGTAAQIVYQNNIHGTFGRGNNPGTDGTFPIVSGAFRNHCVPG